MNAARAGLLLWLLTQVAWASAARFLIAEVVVNGIAQPPAMIATSPDGSVFARREDALAWRLDLANVAVMLLRDIVHINLNAIPGIHVRYDETTLTIEAAVSTFAGTRIDLQNKSPPVLDSGMGAYLNYDLSTFGTRGRRPASAAALEAVLFADALSFASSGVYSSAAQRQPLVRYETSLQRDFPETVRSLVIGDAISHSGALPRSFRFGGISYGTNFATRPDLITFPLPAVPGESRIPTSAELLINGQAMSRVDLAPGPFEIRNVPAITGAGEIQLVTRDALGRQQVVVVPYYVTPALLRPGLVDSGIEIGKVREDFGLESFHYGRGFARALYRRGFTPWFTAEGFGETTARQRTAGGGMTAAIANFAIASGAVAYSTGEHSGNSYSASLERSSQGFSFGLRGQHASAQFAQLGEVAGLHYRVNANVGFSLPSLGSVNLIRAAESRYDLTRTTVSAISYQRQLGRKLSLMLNVNMTKSGDGAHHYAGLTLVMPLDTLASASLSSSRQDGAAEQVFDIRQNLPLDDGWAARARVSAGDALRRRLDAGMTWQNAYGQWSADASHAGSSDSYRLGMNGSVIRVGGLTRAVRQLGDAFAVVSVPGFPDIDVLHENQRIAHTDADGFAIIPRLRPYEPNAISLDTLKLALATELKAPRRTVTPARRAGVLIKFKAATIHGALVRVLQENGMPVPAGALLSTGGESYPVAANGEAWVTGLEAETDAAVVWPGAHCVVRIPVADTTKALPRIGPLTCKGGGA